MYKTLKGLVRPNAKAVGAFVASVVLGVVVRANADVPSDVLRAVEGLVVAVVVWFTSNE